MTARSTRLALCAAAAWVGAAATAHAAPQATCRDLAAAQGLDRALFYGFIYGFTAGKLDGHSDAEIDAATIRLAQMVGDYCLKQPDDRVLAAASKLVGAALMQPER